MVKFLVSNVPHVGVVVEHNAFLAITRVKVTAMDGGWRHFPCLCVGETLWVSDYAIEVESDDPNVEGL